MDRLDSFYNSINLKSINDFLNLNSLKSILKSPKSLAKLAGGCLVCATFIYAG